ncbi:MAG: hypothetical protein R2837_09030 [Aliarcobacter sp.]
MNYLGKFKIFLHKKNGMWIRDDAKYYQTIDGYATAQRSAYVGLKANF